MRLQVAEANESNFSQIQCRIADGPMPAPDPLPWPWPW